MTFAFYLGWAVAAVLVFVGLYALAVPGALADGYGVRSDGHTSSGYVRATGVRDVALGVVLAATAYFHSLPLLVVFSIAGIAVSVTDLAIVWHHGEHKRFHPAHAIHATGIVAFVLIIAMALFAVGR
ncbi:MAG TPA: DUF4267 domain-containing protein [Candidatus Binatia bacterium]|nr:DUF4267 domain-containing protein [Candidatus Binatia bacterium]